MAVVQLDEIGVFRTPRDLGIRKQLELPAFDVQKNLLSHGITEGILDQQMMQYSPQPREVLMLVKHQPFELVEEGLMGLISPHSEELPDVLDVMVLAALERGTGENPCQCWPRSSVVIADDNAERVLHTSQHPKELLIRKLILRGNQQTADDVVGEVVDGEDERDLLGISSDLDVFGINNEDPAEAGTEVSGEDVGAGQLCNLRLDVPEGLRPGVPELIGQFPAGDAVDVLDPEQNLRTMVD